MLYLEKDNDGNITALHSTPTETTTEKAAVNDPRVVAFLGENSSADNLSAALASSDGDLVRVMEDLIFLLIEKNIINFTELPSAAQRKIVTRQDMRRSLPGSDIMVDDIL